eukprot:478132_1
MSTINCCINKSVVSCDTCKSYLNRHFQAPSVNLQTLKRSLPHSRMIQEYIEERTQMQSIQTECGHIHFKDSQTFCNSIQQALSSWKRSSMLSKNAPTFRHSLKANRLHNTAISNVNSICLKCACTLCPFIYKLITNIFNGISTTSKLCFYKDGFVTTTIASIASQILRYPELAMFYLKETEMYKHLLIFYTFGASQKRNFIHYRMTYAKNDIGHQLSCNLILLKREKIEKLMKSCKYGVLFDDILDGMIVELDIQKNDMYYFWMMFTMETIADMFTIFTMCVHFGYKIKSAQKLVMKQLKTKIMNEMFLEKNKCEFLRYRYDYLLKLLSFCLESRKSLNSHYDIRRKYAIWIWKDKYNRMQCHYNKCKKERRECENLYRCKNCVARYCCRNHQKKDWNLSNHKTICLLYGQIKKKQ